MKENQKHIWKIKVLIRILYDEYIEQIGNYPTRSFRNFVKKDLNLMPVFERLKFDNTLIDAFWKQMAEINKNEYNYTHLSKELKAILTNKL